MCGVAAVVTYRGADPMDVDELRRISEQQSRRGPDGSGEWLDPNGLVGLAHRRLAVIDLDARSAQPMRSADGKLVLVFNGEIYNFRAVRDELRAAGHNFRTESDTEVVLAAYAQWREKMYAHLRGMYAFALWDDVRRKLVLARDPYGIKPLYYSDDGRRVCVASQVKALIAGGRISREPSVVGWSGFLLFGSVPDPETIYEAVRAVPAGCYMEVGDAGVEGPFAHTPLAHLWAGPHRAGDRGELIRDALVDSVRHHMVSDVRVGVFLSAGIDSGALLALAQEVEGSAPYSLTLAFDEFRGQARDEAPIAHSIATRYGSHHVTWRVAREEFDAELPRIFADMDQPSIDGINTWFVAKAARELNWKVALSGLGGDELFAGYPSFRDVPRWQRLFSWTGGMPGLSGALAAAVGVVSRKPKLRGLARFGGSWAGAYYLRRGLFMPWELADVAPEWIPRDRDFLEGCLRAINALIGETPDSDYQRVSILESGWYMRHQLLRDADWAGMAHSVEIRVPFVDVELTRRVAPLIGCDRTDAKRILAEAPLRPLPRSVVDRSKTGFETPIREWLTPKRGVREHWSRSWARAVLSAQVDRAWNAG